MRRPVRTLSIINLQGTREKLQELQNMRRSGSSISEVSRQQMLVYLCDRLTFKGSPIHFVCMECIYVPRPPRCQAPFGLRNETHGCMGLNNHKISKCV